MYCDYPGTIEHGTILLVGAIGKYEYRAYVSRIGQNERIEYRCDKGYKLVGPVAATCVDGNWSPTVRTRCVLGQHPKMLYIFRGKRDVGNVTDDEDLDQDNNNGTVYIPTYKGKDGRNTTWSTLQQSKPPQDESLVEKVFRVDRQSKNEKRLSNFELSKMNHIDSLHVTQNLLHNKDNDQNMSMYFNERIDKKVQKTGIDIDSKADDVRHNKFEQSKGVKFKTHGKQSAIHKYAENNLVSHMRQGRHNSHYEADRGG